MNSRTVVVQQQKTVTGTLVSIVDVVKKAEIKKPAIIVVGEVVRFKDRIDQLKKMNQNNEREVLQLFN
ncbi:hypothetical protein ACFOUV_04170 [Oceanobacillus longus]|uniref:Uncharacterized protein n=1 Tax=Oceanobacillus longus TaxID=930120 RepID=A0ABV8GTI7_9BACI